MSLTKKPTLVWSEIWNFYLDFSSEVERIAKWLGLKRVSANLEFRGESVFVNFVIVDSIYDQQGVFLVNDYTKIGEIELDKENDSPYLSFLVALKRAEDWLKEYLKKQIKTEQIKEAELPF